MKDLRIILLLCLLLAPSCVKDVIMDANEKPKVAVCCILSDEPVQTLHISFTKGASKKEAEPVADAEARLIDKTGGSDFEVGVFKRSDESEWTLDYPAELGHTYRLEVSVPGYDLITAEQTMPSETLRVRCAAYNMLSGYIEPWSGWDVTWDQAYDWPYLSWPKGEESPKPESAYVLYQSTSPVWLYAMNYNPETGEHELACELCTDAEVLQDNITGSFYTPPIIENAPNPPYKLNEGIGSSVSDSYDSAHIMMLYPTLEGEPIHESFLRFPPDLSQAFYVSGALTDEYCEIYEYSYFAEQEHNHEVYLGLADDNELLMKGYLMFSAVSVDLDKYLIEAYHFMQIQKSTDLSTIYLRDNVYSNINGGLGIFGAKTSSKHPWNRAYTYIDTGVPRVDINEYLIF